MPHEKQIRINVLYVFLAIVSGLLQTTGVGQTVQNRNVLLVDNFELPVQNQLDGFRNHFQKSPSSASIYRTREIDGKANSRGYSLCLTGNKSAEGWCGAWLHFFDHKQTPKWFDASKFDYLSIWVKGKTGNENVVVKVADKFWFERGDSWAVARTSHVMRGGISTQWKELRIPVAGMRRINPEKLATLVFQFEDLGEQTVYIDDISFRTESGLKVSLPQKTYSVQSSGAQPKSLWVWQTDQLINNSENRKELFEFCNRQNINSIWLQLLYQVEGSPRQQKAKVRFPKQFRRLNAEAHSYGISVHALDGYPEYALNEQQFIPLTLVQSLVEFNKNAKASEAFDGIHFDNEPHLLVGWHSPKHRKQILKEFLELNQKCQRYISEKSKMKYGIDIPFWWEETDPLTKIPCGEVTFNGVSKPASFHCIDMLDNVGVMNYRDTADGADGMISHGRDLLKYAEQKSRCEIFMGVETFAYPYQTVEFLCGLKRSEFYEALDDSAQKLGRLSRIHNYRIRVFDDGENIHIGLEHPENQANFKRSTFDAALGFIAKQLNLKTVSDQTAAGNEVNWKAFSKALSRSGEYKDVTYGQWSESKSGFTRASSRRRTDSFHSLTATAFMSPKITFADETLETFDLQTRLASEYFSKFKKYSGIAVHCYDTFRKLKSNTIDK